MIRPWVLLVATLAGAAQADAPDISLRPVARPMNPQETRLRPVARPAPIEVGRGIAPVDVLAATAPVGLQRSLRPVPRSKAIVEQAMAKKRRLAKGMICGDRDLQGQEVGYVPGKISGCGIQDAVRVRSVLGIPLTQPAMVDCTTAKALKSWVKKGLKPAIGNRGGGVAQIRVAAHYACRTRNNQPGAKISEHGRGRAIDVSGFTLRDGTTLTVLNHWSSRSYGKAFKSMHRKACGIFGTVLGPQSDRFHQDHFHFDTARYRSGSYCR
jgi:hypothetical protein